jgi:hypothetical protein
MAEWRNYMGKASRGQHAPNLAHDLGWTPHVFQHGLTLYPREQIRRKRKLVSVSHYVHSGQHK